MDFDGIPQSLSELYPQWAAAIRALEFRDAVGIPPAENDGRTVYYNSRLLRYCTEEIREFYIAQQLLHIQLAHCSRGRGRDGAVWKRASDAVVNAMLRDEGFSLPVDALLLPEAESASAEELYEVLFAREDGKKEDKPETEEALTRTAPEIPGKTPGKDSAARERDIDDPGLAAAVAGLAELLEPSMQLDFDWFPGTTIRDGVLRHDFRAYPVAHAEILLDTSASVDVELLRAFVRGVKALLQQDAVIRVGCFDTQFYGFQDIRSEQDILALELRGSGGTNFTAAIDAFTGDAENQIIFTDGFAEMPERSCDAVWVVYGDERIHPRGGRVIYCRKSEEKETHEIDFLIT